MYLALYRKFRPESFDKIVGQDHIVRTLTNQIEHDQVGHAYLFCGSRGTGKTSVAKVFARAINCLTPKNGSPCTKCEVCKNLSQSNNMDIIEIDAASNNRVDEIRDLRDKVKYPPLHGKYKVYIIDEVHMLTDSAFNALLKTLEEPPAHVVFILATTEPHKLPATILSRVLRFDFKLVGQENLVSLLRTIFKQSGIKAEEQALTLIASAGEGSVRDTLSIADMCASFSNNDIKYQDVLSVLGASDREVLGALSAAVLNGDIAGFVQVLDREAKAGKNIITLACDLTRYFRDLLVLKACGQTKELVNLPEEEQQKMLGLSQEFSNEKLSEVLQAFSRIESELKYATSPQLLVEVAAIAVCDSKKKRVIEAASGQITPQPQKEQELKKPAAMNPKKAPTGRVETEFQETPEAVQKVEKVADESPLEGIKNARSIWGEVLLSMRDQKLVLLHSACCELSEVEIEKNTFKVTVGSNSIYDMLKNSRNYSDLVACFTKLGYNYYIDIQQKSMADKVKPDKAQLISERLGVEVRKSDKK